MPSVRKCRSPLSLFPNFKLRFISNFKQKSLISFHLFSDKSVMSSGRKGRSKFIGVFFVVVLSPVVDVMADGCDPADISRSVARVIERHKRAAAIAEENSFRAELNAAEAQAVRARRAERAAAVLADSKRTKAEDLWALEGQLESLEDSLERAGATGSTANVQTRQEISRLLKRIEEIKTIHRKTYPGKKLSQAEYRLIDERIVLDKGARADIDGLLRQQASIVERDVFLDLAINGREAGDLLNGEGLVYAGRLYAKKLSLPGGGEFRIAYTVVPDKAGREKVYIFAVGPRENFYDRLKRRLH